MSSRDNEELWKNELEKYLKISINDSSKSSILKEIFKDVITPQLYFTKNHTIDIPEDYTINIGGTTTLYHILSSYNLFHSLPSYYKKGILDILWILLHRSNYDVVRFRCCEDQNGIIVILLNLLNIDADQDVLIMKRIIRLIGVVSGSGISPRDLRRYLYLLRKPSLYSISLLQSLKMMNKIEEGIVKASPFSFFNFGGHENSLTIDPCPFPFQKEYQILFWFRLEHCRDDSIQHLISLLNGEIGLDIFLKMKTLCVKVTNSNSEHTTLECGDYPLSIGVWYHLCITHTKPRMSFFAKHELSVHIDHQLVFQEVMRFPSSTAIGLMSNASIGKNFDGQMGPIYLLLEPLPPLGVQLVARQDAGKTLDDIPAGYPIDFLANLTTADKKSIPFTSKIYSVYHPTRSNGDMLIDIHNNHHCKIGPLTRCWTLTSVRDTLISLGGIICFLPLLPKLLIENEDIRDDILQKSASAPRNRSNSIQKSYLAKTNGMISAGVGLGTSLLQTITDSEIESIFSNRTLSYIEGTIDELQEEKPIGLILSIIAQSLKGHKVNQTSFLFGGGVEMIQYSLTGMPRGAYILKQEDESCILGLLQLRTACLELPELDAILTKRLLCNFHIWSNASFKLQSSLFSVLLANIKAQPEVFLASVGVQLFFDAISLYYLHTQDTPPSESTSVTQPSSLVTTSSLEVVTAKIEVTSKVESESAVEDPSATSPSRVHFQAENPSTPVTRPNMLNPARSFRKSVNRRMSQIDPDIDMSEFLSDTSTLSPVTPKQNPSHDTVDLRSAFKKESSRTLSCKFDSSQTFHHDKDTDEDDDDESQTEDELQHTKLMTALYKLTVGDARTSLTNEERKSLRQSLQAIIMILMTYSNNSSDIKPLVYFLCQCNDEVVLEESLQLLLCLIIKDTSSTSSSNNRSKYVTYITEHFKGSEEFSSFLLCKFSQHSYEPLRCVTMTLLVHYYLRIESLPPSLLLNTSSSSSSSYSKKKKNSKLFKAREKYTSMIEGQGLDRFQACGGFALLSLFMNEFKLKSSELTYHALLDMILTSNESDKQLSSIYRNFYYDYCTTIGRNDKKFNIGPRLIDENTEVRNSACLPVFFQVLPRLPSNVQERVYFDLLGLLKHNSKNRDLFCQDPNWHICLYELVGQLMAVSEGCTTNLQQSDIVPDLQAWALYYNPGQEDEIIALFSKNGNTGGGGGSNSSLHDPVTKGRYGLFPRQIMFDIPRSMSPIQHQRNQSSPTIPSTSNNSNNQSLSTLDMWFDIGMKIYATLLLHALDYKNGYKEVEKTLSQSFDSSHGVAVSLAVFSHLLNEITFNIQSKYKDAQKLSKSGNTEETISATNKLDNMLSVLVMISIHFVEDDSIVGLGIPDFLFAKRRLELIEETKKEISLEVPCSYQCNETSHTAVCVLANDLCRCGHSRSLHTLSSSSSSATNSNKSISQIVEEKLALEIESGVLISRARSGDAHHGGGVVYTSISKATETPNHSWIDVRGNEMRPQVQDTIRPLSRNLSKKKFSMEEVLHPLERGYEVPRGRMVVILQALRYIDLFFWPSSNRLRNEHLLNFISNLSSNMSLLQENNNSTSSSSNSNKKGKKLVLPFSLYNSIIRMSLYVLHGLSPFTQLSIVNLKRIHILMKNIDKISIDSSPRNEWIMIIIYHLLTTLQRLHQSFYRLYTILELPYYTEIISDGGILDNNQKIQQMKEFQNFEENDSQIFLQFFQNNNESIFNNLNNIFNNSTGRLLIDYIMSCIEILITLKQSQSDVIATIMGDKGYLAYSLLIEKHEKLLNQFLLTKFPTTTTTTTGRSRSTSKDIRRDSLSGTPTSSTTTSNRKDSITTLEESGGGGLSSTSPRRHSLSTDSERLRTFSSSVEEEDSSSNSKFYENILIVLKWLRDPFIRMNLMTGENMIRCALTIEQYEKYHVKAFYEDLVQTKEQFFDNRNLRIKYSDEMNELMELGDEMIVIHTEQGNRRENHEKIMNEVFNKASAMFWNNCLRDFDEEWSPWTSPLKDKSQYILSLHKDKIGRRMITKRGSEVYDHSDAAYWGGRSRDQSEYDQLVNSETTGNSGSGSGSGTTGNTGNSTENLVIDPPSTSSPSSSSSSSSSFLKNTLLITRPKLSRLKSEDNWDEKDDASADENGYDDDIEETSVTIPTKPDKGLVVRFPFQQIEKKKPLWASMFIWQPDEKEIYTTEVTQIMTEQALFGILLLTNKSLYFHPKKRIGGFTTNPDEFRNKRWKLEKLLECYGRRYLLQNCGIELFFEDSSELFLAFNTTHNLHKFFRFLYKQSLPNLLTGSSLSPSHIYQISPWTDLWRKRLISNYEYIMRLNIIAGRSYNDITQYPIFPWILQDYHSSSINLQDTSIYRDLSKPIGALNEQRLKEILDRYKSFGMDDDDMPSFMYGSHYSSAGIILHFLVRQEPFTSMAITLQAGRFDCPDRLFFNIKETWKCCNTSLSDVKELLPELFYLPELFLNTNNLPLGELQDDRGIVNHVILPLWCSTGSNTSTGNPYEFIRIHRDALESDYVSDHLHEWIDLIFGYKQTGQAAIDACNVFHYLTYENAIDIESIQDPLIKNATKAQVTHFGQTPSQLLTKEHPKRLKQEECLNSFTLSFNNIKKLHIYTPIKQYFPSGNNNGVGGSSSVEHGSIVTIASGYDKLIVFYSDCTIAMYKWNNYSDSDGHPYTLKQDKYRSFPYTSWMLYPYTNATQLYDQHRRWLMKENAATNTAAATASTSNSYFNLFNSMTMKKSSKIDQQSEELKTTGTDTSGEGGEATSSPSPPTSTSTSRTLPQLEEEDSSRNISTIPIHQPQSLLKKIQGKKIQKKNVVIRLTENTNSDRLITCGYWDNHVKVHGLDSFREYATSTGGHIGGINCIRMDEDKYLIITGGDDCTCRVWVLENPTLVASLEVEHETHHNIMNESRDSIMNNMNDIEKNTFGNPNNMKCVHVLWGHNSAVIALAYSTYHNIILSGSENGLLCIHIARTGEYIRSIYTLTLAENQPLVDLKEYCQGDGCPIDQVEISNAGYLYAYSSMNLQLCVFWINGQCLNRITLETSIECLLLNSYGSMLFCGGSDGTLIIRRAWDLQEVDRSIQFPDHGAITAMILQGDEYYLIVGTEDGMIHVCTDPETKWKPMTGGLLKNTLFS